MLTKCSYQILLGFEDIILELQIALLEGHRIGHISACATQQVKPLHEDCIKGTFVRFRNIIDCISPEFRLYFAA